MGDLLGHHKDMGFTLSETGAFGVFLAKGNVAQCNFILFFFERERVSVCMCMSGRGAEESERESEAGSTPRMEPGEGLDSTIPGSRPELNSRVRR